MGTASAGDRPGPDAALWDELEAFRPRLRRLVSFRLDGQLRRRIDSSDVIQEAFVDVTRRFQEFRATDMPFFLWVRLITTQKLAEIHRRHLGTLKRDVRRELPGSICGDQTSLSLARALADHGPSPSQELLRKEREKGLQRNLESMKPADREILLMRHFEDLSNSECAQLLGLSDSGAKLRHLRALGRLREVLSAQDMLPDLGCEE